MRGSKQQHKAPNGLGRREGGQEAKPWGLHGWESAGVFPLRCGGPSRRKMDVWMWDREMDRWSDTDVL